MLGRLPAGEQRQRLEQLSWERMDNSYSLRVPVTASGLGDVVLETCGDPQSIIPFNFPLKVMDTHKNWDG